MYARLMHAALKQFPKGSARDRTSVVQQELRAVIQYYSGFFLYTSCILRRDLEKKKKVLPDTDGARAISFLGGQNTNLKE